MSITLDDLWFRPIGQELQRDRREGTVEIVSGGKGPFGHPYNGETAVVGHAIARAQGVDKLGRISRAHDLQLVLASIENGRKARSRREPVGFGEAVRHHHFLFARGLRQASTAEVELVQARLATLGQRDELTGGWRGELGNIEQRQLDNAAFGGGNARNLRDLGQQRLGGAPCQGEDVGELQSFIVGDAGFLERIQRTDRHHQRCDAARDDEGNRE